MVVNHVCFFLLILTRADSFSYIVIGERVFSLITDRALVIPIVYNY